MDKRYINLGAVKAKEIDGELYVSCRDFSKALAEKEREISDLCKENDELKKQISELESENKESKKKIHGLRVELAEKDALLKIRGGLNTELLPFSSDEYEEYMERELDELRELHNQDRITISQLKITIDTLVDRCAGLRGGWA